MTGRSESRDQDGMTANSRQLLVRVNARLLKRGTPSANMTELARSAGVSTSTAYRHFASLDDVAQEHRTQVLIELRDFGAQQPEIGRELLSALSRRWVDLVMEHGHVLVTARSQRGFYERIANAIPSTVLAREARRKALFGVLDELGLPPTLEEDAAMLYNTLFDPRDILDLLNLRGFSPVRVTELLLAAFLGALDGWVAALDADR